MDIGHVPPLPTTGVGAPAGRPRASIRILLVEDNRDIARVLTCLLTRSGYRVTAAAGIAEAERLSADDGPFDLLISDLNLLDGSGLELIRRIGPIPGVAVSGYSSDIDLQECLDAGFVDLLAKPLQFAALEDLIRRLFGPDAGEPG